MITAGIARFAAIGAIAVLGACTVPSEPVEVFDPYESINRGTHAFNKGLDSFVVRPTSKVYGFLLPRPVRRGVSNFANFVDTPRFVLNDLAQGNIDDAVHNAVRFGLNAVFGLGVLDFASSAGLESRRTGLGETFFVWGIPEGAYIELPILGPSTERDALGQISDFFTNPVSGILSASQHLLPPLANVLDRVGQRYEFGSTIDSLLYESADSYAQTRNLYLQNRRFELGEEDDFSFDPYEDPYAE